MSQTNLLPIGFYDLLFEEAKQNHDNINLALEIFFAQKYHLIKTPLVEFETLKPGSHNTNNFRTIDIISGNDLVFRSDITAQIQRLLNTRLAQEKLPLKLCYVGDVLCAKSENLYADRQQTQVGIELIGSADIVADQEVIELTLTALEKIKKESLNKLLIEFSSPEFLQYFLQEIKDEVENIDLLADAIIQKNFSLIKKLAGKNAENIIQIAASNHDLNGMLPKISTTIKSKELILELTKKIAKITTIAQMLQKKFPEIELRFDLFGDHKSSYYSGVHFDIFWGNFSYPIARGGRYQIAVGNNKTEAVGATIYMNHLRKV